MSAGLTAAALLTWRLPRARQGSASPRQQQQQAGPQQRTSYPQAEPTAAQREQLRMASMMQGGQYGNLSWDEMMRSLSDPLFQPGQGPGPPMPQVSPLRLLPLVAVLPDPGTPALARSRNPACMPLPTLHRSPCLHGRLAQPQLQRLSCCCLLRMRRGSCRSSSSSRRWAARRSRAAASTSWRSRSLRSSSRSSGSAHTPPGLGPLPSARTAPIRPRLHPLAPRHTRTSPSCPAAQRGHLGSGCGLHHRHCTHPWGCGPQGVAACSRGS